MTSLKEDLTRRAGEFVPSSEAYEHVLGRAATKTDGGPSKPAAVEIECCPVEVPNRGARGHHPVPAFEHANHRLLRNVFRLSPASGDEVERPR